MGLQELRFDREKVDLISPSGFSHRGAILRALPAMRGSGWACGLAVLLASCALAKCAQYESGHPFAAHFEGNRGATRSLLLGHARHFKKGDQIKVRCATAFCHRCWRLCAASFAGYCGMMIESDECCTALLKAFSTSADSNSSEARIESSSFAVAQLYANKVGPFANTQ